MVFSLVDGTEENKHSGFGFVEARAEFPQSIDLMIFRIRMAVAFL